MAARPHPSIKSCNPKGYLLCRNKMLDWAINLRTAVRDGVGVVDAS